MTITLAPEIIADTERVWSVDGQTVIHSDCITGMGEMESNSVDLIVTSPPYPGVNAMWGELFAPENFDAAHAWLDTVWNECARVLKPGSRLCINIANIGRRPYRRNNARVAQGVSANPNMCDEGEYIWSKDGTAQNTAWGTFRNPSNPLPIDQHEYILVFRKNGERDTPTRDYVIDRADFLEWRNSIWEIKPESSKRTKHVAPFPMELPRRLITLYSFESELVLDPFLGSGTTLRAAKLLNRKGIGFEHDAKYFELAKRNLAQYKMDGF